MIRAQRPARDGCRSVKLELRQYRDGVRLHYSFNRLARHGPALISPDLPLPDAAARAVSAALSDRLRTEIVESGGWIRFDRYMQRALYEPGLGYYSGGSVKLGPAGDFTTTAELGF